VSQLPTALSADTHLEDESDIKMNNPVPRSTVVDVDVSSDDGFDENDPEYIRAQVIKQGDQKTDQFFLKTLKPAGFVRERQTKNGECAVSCVSSLRFQRYDLFVHQFNCCLLGYLAKRIM
jgi:hypothetical protein